MLAGELQLVLAVAKIPINKIQVPVFAFQIVIIKQIHKIVQLVRHLAQLVLVQLPVLHV
jgi:hypothetical protein